MQLHNLDLWNIHPIIVAILIFWLSLGCVDGSDSLISVLFTSIGHQQTDVFVFQAGNDLKLVAILAGKTISLAVA